MMEIGPNLSETIQVIVVFMFLAIAAWAFFNSL